MRMDKKRGAMQRPRGKKGECTARRDSHSGPHCPAKGGMDMWILILAVALAAIACAAFVRSALDYRLADQIEADQIDSAEPRELDGDR